MISVDSGETLPADVIDAGDTSTPPTDIYDSMFLMISQVTGGVITPTFTAVDPTEVINPERGLILYVKAGGTSTTVTVTVPGVQEYTGAPKDDLVVAGVQNSDRVFYLPEWLADPALEVMTVSYSPTSSVSAALVKVN